MTADERRLLHSTPEAISYQRLYCDKPTLLYIHGRLWIHLPLESTPGMSACFRLLPPFITPHMCPNRLVHHLRLLARGSCFTSTSGLAACTLSVLLHRCIIGRMCIEKCAVQLCNQRRQATALDEFSHNSSFRTNREMALPLLDPTRIDYLSRDVTNTWPQRLTERVSTGTEEEDPSHASSQYESHPYPEYPLHDTFQEVDQLQLLHLSDIYKCLTFWGLCCKLTKKSTWRSATKYSRGRQKPEVYVSVKETTPEVVVSGLLGLSHIDNTELCTTQYRRRSQDRCTRLSLR